MNESTSRGAMSAIALETESADDGMCPACLPRSSICELRENECRKGKPCPSLLQDQALADRGQGEAVRHFARLQVASAAVGRSPSYLVTVAQQTAEQTVRNERELPTLAMPTESPSFGRLLRAKVQGHREGKQRPQQEPASSRLGAWSLRSSSCGRSGSGT